jgi:catechol 2,3-dioxygenase-like lactoylglutathione lyase family enzyme
MSVCDFEEAAMDSTAVARAAIAGIAPCFIVSNVGKTMAFYREKLGFETEFEDPAGDPFFGIVRRNNSMVFLKHGHSKPTPHSAQGSEMKWDAYVSVPDPDALAAEFAANGAEFLKPLGITSENLRGFEVRDPDGYVLFFGRPE